MRVRLSPGGAHPEPLNQLWPREAIAASPPLPLPTLPCAPRPATPALLQEAKRHIYDVIKVSPGAGWARPPVAALHAAWLSLWVLQPPSRPG